MFTDNHMPDAINHCNGRNDLINSKLYGRTNRRTDIILWQNLPMQ